MPSTEGYPSTPELDKVLSLGPRREAVEEFITWLFDDQHYLFSRGQDEYGRPLTFTPNRSQLMADFFGVDLAKMDAEQKAVLEYVRNTNA